METKRSLFLTVTGVALIFAFSLLLFAVLKRNISFLPGVVPTPGGKQVVTTPFGSLEKFKTDQEFREYMQNSQLNGNYGGSFNALEDRMTTQSAPGGVDSKMSLPNVGGGQVPERVSTTNVQVLGIDEPDIMKIDGENMFYSSPYSYGLRPIPMLQEKRIAPMSEPLIGNDFRSPPLPPEQSGGIYSIKMFPPQSLKKLGTVAASGDMLLADNTLVVFNENDYGKRSIDGYDVSSPEKPVKKWSIPYQSNSYKVQARLYRGKMYLVTRIDAGGDYPCPVRPFGASIKGGFVPCTEIYHPVNPVSNDTLYTVSRISIDNGTVEKNVSFTGSTNESVIYMSRDSLYVAYHYSGDLAKIMHSFVSENRDLFPATLVDKLGKLQGYDISTQAKLMELMTILSRFTAGVEEDKRLAFENNMNNRMKKFMETNARQLEKTGLVKVDIDDFSIDATGEVPGQVLNQYSMDEFEGNLRIATTVGQSGFLGQFGQRTASFSDMYVLDSGLRTIGTVTDLGKTERIYAVRFMADRGYIVTFRQTDPFYVLDLSNPRSPQLKGELKIPGYSSYLHPLTEDLLVGVGQEGGSVKLSLFDVSSPEKPVEIDKYSMSEYWSEAMNNPHAFLADEKHKVFFMPGGQGGYVFSYKGKKLDMVKAVSDYQVQRAAYVNDYLYIVGQNGIAAYNENDWSKAGQLEL